MNYSETNKTALGSEYLRYLLPNAKQTGRELQCGDIFGNPGRSFCVNLDTGAWIDNSTGQKGGDIVSLIAERERLSQGEAARHLSQALGIEHHQQHQPGKRGNLPRCPVIGEPTYIYPYYNQDGSWAFDVLRYEKPGHQKTIRSRGDYNQKLLYNAAEALQYDTVFVPEGEKCVEVLRNPIVGLSGLCCPGGAGKWRDEHSQALKGKKVIILPDNDEPGQKHGLQVAESVFPYAVSVKIVNLPGLPPKGDIVDWLEAGNDTAQLVKLIDLTPFYEPPQNEEPVKPGIIVALGVRVFLAKEIPPREHILFPVIPEQGLVMMYASRGIGKTFVALSIAVAVAGGGHLFHWKAEKPRRTLYIDGEMPAKTMQDRIKAIEAGAGCCIDDEFFKIITPDEQPEGYMPNLLKHEGQAMLTELAANVDFIVVDNLVTLCRGGKENEAESWAIMQEWLLFLRRSGKSVLLVHHAGKTGDQRGSSAREDILDTVIKLNRPSEYMASDGAKFSLELTKARGIIGPDADPFEAQLIQSPDTHILTWEFGKKEDKDIDRVRDLLSGGFTQREIAEAMGPGWSASTVNRFINKHGLKVFGPKKRDLLP